MCQQIRVLSLINNPALIQEHDPIGVAQHIDPMGDQQHRFSRHPGEDALQYLLLGLDIDG